MSDQLTLTAETRERGGKGASRDLRRNGRVPAVVYGGKEEPLMIHVEEKLLMKQLMTGHFMNSVVMIEVGGKQVRTLPKDVAFHPVKDRPIHADFLRIAKDATVQVAVPVAFENEEASPGLKRGGVLEIIRPQIELEVTAGDIPEHIVLDISEANVGDTLHISDIALPDGVKPTIERNFVIANIQAPSTLGGGDAD